MMSKQKANNLNILICAHMFPKLDAPNALISGMVKNPYNQTKAVAELVSRIDVVTTSSCQFHDSVANINVWGVGLAPFKGVIKSTIFEFKMLLKIFKLLRCRNYSVIHIHHLNIPLIFLLRALGFTSASIIYTAHGTSTPELNAARQGGWGNHFMLKVNGYIQHMLDVVCWKLADLVLLPSGFQKDEMETTYLVPRRKMRVIYNGYDPKLYFPSPEMRAKARDEMQVSSNGKVILFVGRAAVKKGIVELILTCDKLRQRRADFLLVLVVGYLGRQVAYRDKVKSLALERSWVKYYECVPEMSLPEFYNAADICVFPSIGYESLPTVIYEAGACRKPIVTQGAWGIPEAIHGRFISEQSILESSFDEALNEALEHDHDVEWPEFERFSWKYGGHAIKAIYEKLI